jgi:hypothetical protein
MKFFTGYIGQREAVDMGENICNMIASEQDLPLPPLSLTGYAGLGKTHYAELLARKMSEASSGQGSEKEFRLVTINSASSLPVLIGQLIECAGKRIVFFLDEAQAINKKVLNFLKPILETEKQTKSVRYGDFVFEANPFNQMWIFASNENLRDSAIFGPSGRAHTLQFQPYTRGEVKELMKYKAARWAKNFTLKDDAIDYLADRVLPNGRAISTLIEVECLYMGGTIGLDKAKEIVKKYKRFPLGLGANDIKTLMFLGSDENGKQVNEIASHCAGEPAKDTSYRLQWLAGLGFTGTKAGKKVLTSKGKEYLVKLEESQKKAKAKK